MFGVLTLLYCESGCECDSFSIFATLWQTTLQDDIHMQVWDGWIFKGWVYQCKYGVMSKRRMWGEEGWSQNPVSALAYSYQ